MVSGKKILPAVLVWLAVIAGISGGVLIKTLVEKPRQPETETVETAEVTEPENLVQPKTAASAPTGTQPEPAAKEAEGREQRQQEESREDLEKKLMILKEPKLYSYDHMKKDAELLLGLYPDILTEKSLGQTADCREIICFVIGEPSASEKILITGGIHAREYMTSQLVMKQMTAFLEHVAENGVYQEKSYGELLKNRAVYVIPMVNPDGISISQFGYDGVRTEAVRAQIERIAGMDGMEPGGDYFCYWKANGNGVDLNRNFDALWEQYADPAGHPSSDHYKGEYPGCEAESEALISLTRQEKFRRTISYHTQGSVIYWYFAQEGELYERTNAFARRISNLTGYPMDANYEALDPAGYKDWAISKEGIPSLTIEVGRDTSPVPWEQFGEIWEKNKYVFEETLLDLG